MLYKTILTGLLAAFLTACTTLSPDAVQPRDAIPADWLIPCPVPLLESPSHADLVLNRNALYWALIQCNIDKDNIREYINGAS